MHLRVDVLSAVKFVLTIVRLHLWLRNAILERAERHSKVVLSVKSTFVNSVLKTFATVQFQIFLSAVLALLITVRPVKTKMMD